MTTLQMGQAAPWFHAATHTNPTYSFQSLGGRYVLLLFLPPGDDEARAICAKLESNLNLFSPRRIMCFGVVPDPILHADLKEHLALRWFLDGDGSVARLYGAQNSDGGFEPQWLILDPSLRVLVTGPADQLDGLFSLIQRLAPPDQHAGTLLNAPVLIVPRVLELGLCRHLIDLYLEKGGMPSGTMREIDGKTVGGLATSRSAATPTSMTNACVALFASGSSAGFFPKSKRRFSSG